MMTKSAAEKVAGLMQDEGASDLALRVSVRSGGCSGFTYEMYFDGDVADDDTVVEENGVRLVIDAASKPLLEGASLDYKDGLTDAGFKIENPNAKRSCGCGKSFS